MKSILLSIPIVLLAISAWGNNIPSAYSIFQPGREIQLLTTSIPTFGPSIVFENGYYLVFGVFVPNYVNSSMPNTISSALTIAGLGTFTQSNTFSGTICFPGTTCNVDFGSGSFLVPNTVFRPTASTIQFTYNGQVTPLFHFNFVEPVPEPSTWLMIATGAMAIIRKKFYMRASGQ